MKFTFRGGRLIAKNVSKPIPLQPPSEESGILASMWNFLKEKPATHFKTDAWIERIVILGISNSPKVIVLTTEGGETRHLQFKHDSSTNSMTIKKPAVNIAQEWTISMHA
ncbi:unnamed protein product [Porites evermanni]|uniref:Uncharacterized protein n=2 Tax=Porites TaxID=46719 RepID=A0ABN8RPB1_9CNID|nr:unnamed protein product [Porites evermanni]